MAQYVESPSLNKTYPRVKCFPLAVGDSWSLSEIRYKKGLFLSSAGSVRGEKTPSYTLAGLPATSPVLIFSRATVKSNSRGMNQAPVKSCRAPKSVGPVAASR